MTLNSGNKQNTEIVQAVNACTSFQDIEKLFARLFGWYKLPPKVKCSDYPATMATIQNQTNVATLKSHPDYESAKRGGDVKAAKRVVDSIIKPAVVDSIRKMLAPNRPVVVVSVHQREGKNINMIPIAYAHRLARMLGGRDWRTIVKISGEHNTNADAITRSRNVQVFAGEMPPINAQIVVVDDTFTTGGTITALIDYLAQNGNIPVVATTLAIGRYGKDLKPSKDKIIKMLDKIGISEAEFNHAFGYSPDTLTGAAIQQYILNGSRGLAGARNRFPDARSAGSVSSSGQLGSSGQPAEVSQRNDTSPSSYLPTTGITTDTNIDGEIIQLKGNGRTARRLRSGEWKVYEDEELYGTAKDIDEAAEMLLESAFNDRIILDEDPDKTRYVIDCQGRIAAAQSFQDIQETFELLFPGVTEKHKAFVEQSDLVVSSLTSMQDTKATPEAQYEAMNKLEGVASYKLDKILLAAGMADLDVDKLIHQLRAKLPEKMLDSYILEAGEMIWEIDKVQVKQEQYNDLHQQMTSILDAIGKKYEPQMQEADAKFREVVNEFNDWNVGMGQGFWQKAKDGEKYRPWSEESVKAFNEEYHSGFRDWQTKLMAASEKYKTPVYDAQIADVNQSTSELNNKLLALKVELEQAKQQAYDAVIGSILAKSPVTEQQAAEWAKNNVIFDKSAMAKSAKNGYTKKDIERDVLLFYRLTGGRLPRLELTTTRKARSAAAHWSGELFIGHNFGQRTLWHEMAHLLEDDPKIKAAAIAFRDRRRDDAQLHRLKDLVPGSNYDPDEVAYKDSWLDPYVGKDYGQRSTEVVSMGMQQLHSVDALFELHEADPEHLAFMLGLCASTPVIDTEAIAKKQAVTQGKVAKTNTQESFLKELDKQVAKAGDFYSADGYSVEETRSYSYKSGKQVTRAEIRYNKEFDDEGNLKRYNSYTLKSVKAAKRALFLWYQAGKPVSTMKSVGVSSPEKLNLGNIVYQLERSTKELPDYILQTPLSGA